MTNQRTKPKKIKTTKVLNYHTLWGDGMKKTLIGIVILALIIVSAFVLIASAEPQTTIRGELTIGKGNSVFINDTLLDPPEIENYQQYLNHVVEVKGALFEEECEAPAQCYGNPKLKVNSIRIAGEEFCGKEIEATGTIRKLESGKGIGSQTALCGTELEQYGFTKIKIPGDLELPCAGLITTKELSDGEQFSEIVKVNCTDTRNEPDCSIHQMGCKLLITLEETK